MNKADDLLPIGLEDCLPIDAARITQAMRASLDALEGHGYDRVRPPLVEFERSLAGRMADGSDSEQSRKMFRFTDPASLRTLALRSDITPQIGRIASTSMESAPRPLRLSYCGETAVMTADQLDPTRERLQLGGELIGADTAQAASEIVSVAAEALSAAGLTGISVDFTLPDLVDTLCAEALPLDASQVDAVRRELDTKDAGGLKAVGGEAYLPLLYAAGPFDDALPKLRDIDAGGALASRIKGLQDIADSLSDDIRITLDPTERHGFEYQSWFGFTLYADGVRGAVGRGGTYKIAGSEEAAIGFTLYIDRMAANARHPQKRDTVYLPLGYDRDAASLLRTGGWRTIAALNEDDDGRKLGATHVLEGNTPKPL